MLAGIDISPSMVRQAQRNLGMRGLNGRIHVQAADAAFLPFADGIFSGVVSTGDFHRWKDPVLALSEAYRVLKPGGYALIFDLVRNMPKALCRDIRARFGGLRLALLWLHSFEEPFLNAEKMAALGRMTDFSAAETRFTGAICCLVLKKEGISAEDQGEKGSCFCSGTLKNASSSSKISMPNCITNSILSLSESIF